MAELAQCSPAPSIGFMAQLARGQCLRMHSSRPGRNLGLGRESQHPPQSSVLIR